MVVRRSKKKTQLTAVYPAAANGESHQDVIEIMRAILARRHSPVTVLGKQYGAEESREQRAIAQRPRPEDSPLPQRPVSIVQPFERNSNQPGETVDDDRLSNRTDSGALAPPVMTKLIASSTVQSVCTTSSSGTISM